MIEEVTSLANQTQYYVTKSWHSSHSNGKREAEVGRGAIFAQHFQWLQQRMFARRPPSMWRAGVVTSFGTAARIPFGATVLAAAPAATDSSSWAEEEG